jgi:hypothetical protein
MMLRRFWEKWKAFGQFMGDLLARVVLSLFYFTVLVPFAIGIRLTRDQLGLKSVPRRHWVQREAMADSLEAARKQS